MNETEAKYKYWNAIKIKWFTLGLLSSFIVALFLSFLAIQSPADEMKWFMVIFITGLGGVIFYEWYMTPPNTYFGKILEKIFELSYQRIKHLESGKAYITIKHLAILLITLTLLCFLMWFFPEKSAWFQFGIAFLAGTMGTYIVNEEFKAPKGFRQRASYFFSVTVFILVAFLFYYTLDLEVEYGNKKLESLMFFIGLGGCFSTGLLGAMVKAFYALWVDRKAEKCKGNLERSEKPLNA
jgi:hypothetical protein